MQHSRHASLHELKRLERAGYCGFVPSSADVQHRQGVGQPGQRAQMQADMLLLTLDQYSRGCASRAP